MCIFPFPLSSFPFSSRRPELIPPIHPVFASEINPSEPNSSLASLFPPLEPLPLPLPPPPLRPQLFLKSFVFHCLEGVQVILPIFLPPLLPLSPAFFLSNIFNNPSSVFSLFFGSSGSDLINTQSPFQSP